MKTLLFATLIGFFSATQVMADPVTFREARKSLSKGRATEVVIADLPFLSEKDQAILSSLRETIPYYGAIALSPDEGLYVDWLNASGQHHSTKAAREAALAHCAANKQPASAECVIVLDVMPKGRARPMTLSAPATTALLDDYRKLATPRAFAISDATGHFAFAEGAAEDVLKDCQSKTPEGQSCRVFAEDR